MSETYCLIFLLVGGSLGINVLVGFNSINRSLCSSGGSQLLELSIASDFLLLQFRNSTHGREGFNQSIKMVDSLKQARPTKTKRQPNKKFEFFTLYTVLFTLCAYYKNTFCNHTFFLSTLVKYFEWNQSLIFIERVRSYLSVLVH